MATTLNGRPRARWRMTRPWRVALATAAMAALLAALVTVAVAGRDDAPSGPVIAPIEDDTGRWWQEGGWFVSADDEPAAAPTVEDTELRALLDRGWVPGGPMPG
jgi:hypothetical protein